MSDDIESVSNALRTVGDSGTSLQAGKAAKQAQHLSRAAAVTMLRAAGVGRLMTNDLGHRLILGKKGGLPRLKASQVLQDFGAVAAMLANDADSTVQKVQDV